MPITRAAKFVLLGAVLALLFGPRLTAHDAPVTSTTLTAAVLGPTTSDHDSVGPGTTSPKELVHLVAALVAAVVVIAPSRRRARSELGTVTSRDVMSARFRHRRGPPLLPA